MNKLKLILTLLFTLILISQKGECAQEASQILTVGLPQVLSIEKIIVENTEYQRDEPLPNVKVRGIRNVDENNIMLDMTPIRVQVHTNSSTPIIVSAKFMELKHEAGLYDFDPANLIIEPQSYTINDPYDHVITDLFRPTADVKPDTVKGLYQGKVFFTLGAI